MCQIGCKCFSLQLLFTTVSYSVVAEHCSYNWHVSVILEEENVAAAISALVPGGGAAAVWSLMLQQSEQVGADVKQLV